MDMSKSLHRSCHLVALHYFYCCFSHLGSSMHRFLCCVYARIMHDSACIGSTNPKCEANAYKRPYLLNHRPSSCTGSSERDTPSDPLYTLAS